MSWQSAMRARSRIAAIARERERVLGCIASIGRRTRLVTAVRKSILLNTVDPYFVNGEPCRFCWRNLGSGVRECWLEVDR
jgi:hypothetical protein